MELPKTWTDAGIWFAVQFPVLGAVVLGARWAIRETGRFYDQLIGHLREVHGLQLAEKDARRTDVVAEQDRQLGEKDRRIAELEAEVKSLERKIERMRKAEGEK